jgi:HlyD family secretion protein
MVLRSNPGQALAGKVARVEAVSDSVTEERVAQVGFDQAPAGLSVGELAEVTLSLPTTAPAVLLPNAAIKRVQAQTGVWVIDDGAPALRAGAHRPGQPGRPGAGPRRREARHDRRRAQREGHRRHSRITVVESLSGRQP